jgi:hypothetical protein
VLPKVLPQSDKRGAMLMDFATGLLMLTSALSSAEKLKKLFKKDDLGPEVREELVELQSALLDVKENFIAAREENSRLNEEVARLNSAAEIKDELEFRDDVYFHNNDGPYCSGCFDAKQVLVRVTQMGRQKRRMTGLTFECPACQAMVGQRPPDRPPSAPVSIG